MNQVHVWLLIVEWPSWQARPYYYFTSLLEYSAAVFTLLLIAPLGSVQQQADLKKPASGAFFGDLKKRLAYISTLVRVCKTC